MKKRGFAHRRTAALCAAALALLPLGTGAGRIEDLTGVAYVVEGQTPTPIQSSQNQGQGVTQTSGKLNSLVEDGVIRVSDLERVAEIWLAANVRAHDFIPRQYWEGQLETVRTLFPQAELYVWQDGDGAVQGFVGLSGEHIEGIFVWPPAQSRGVGRALLDRAKAAHGRLTLNVYRNNDRAAAFYRREGFQTRGESVDESTGEAECRMVWERRRGC